MRVDREMIRVAGRDRDFFGVLLAGSGSVWTNNAKFEVVGPTVLTADGDIHLKPDEPMNLNFEK
jgi:hypothetical protein